MGRVARITSLYRWLGMAEKSPEALAAKPHPGPRPRLTAELLQEFERLLLQGAKAHAEHVRKILRRRLNWSSQKPQLKAKQRNDEKIAH